MMQHIEGRHLTDEQGRPAGGDTKGVGIDIRWQDGPLGRHAKGCIPSSLPGSDDAKCAPDCNRGGPNGAFVEGVLAAALDRIEWYQRTGFNCRENSIAITKIQEALMWLDSRTKRREAEGVEGTHGFDAARLREVAMAPEYGAAKMADPRIRR